MMYLPLPLLFRPPPTAAVLDARRGMLDPGITLQDADGHPRGVIRIPEECRYTGFWRLLGKQYDPNNFDLAVFRDGTRLATLQVRKNAGFFSGRSYTFQDSHGQPAGSFRIERSKVRNPWRHDRLVLMDAREAPFAHVEIKANLTLTCDLVDEARGQTYRVDYKQNGLLCSDAAEDIDARLILAWRYYTDLDPSTDA